MNDLRHLTRFIFCLIDSTNQRLKANRWYVSTQSFKHFCNFSAYQNFEACQLTFYNDHKK